MQRAGLFRYSNKGFKSLTPLGRIEAVEVQAFALTCSEVNKLTGLPICPRASTDGAGALTRNVTPPMATSAQSGPVPSNVPRTEEIREDILYIRSSGMSDCTRLALMWHIAIANASEASSDIGVLLRSSASIAISCTCSLELSPKPVTASLTSRGANNCTLMPDASAAIIGHRLRLAYCYGRSHITCYKRLFYGNFIRFVLCDVTDQLRV